MKRGMAMLLALVLLLGIPGYAAGTNGRRAPEIISIVNDGADITVRWQTADWKGADRYELQLSRSNSGKSSFSSVKTVRLSVEEGSSYEFSVGSRGYYAVRLRVQDVDRNYSEWSDYSETVSVSSEDVRRSGPPPEGNPQGGPGVSGNAALEGAGPGEAAAFHGGGPGAKGAEAQNSSGSGYGSSSPTDTVGKVLVNTYAQNGWQSDTGGRWYLMEGGFYPKNSWKKIDGSFYHFNETGYMDWNRWIRELNGSWYFCRADGRMAVGWNNINEEWYYMDPANGAMLTAGEYLIDGKHYRIRESGAAARDTWVEGHYYDSSGVRKS